MIARALGGVTRIAHAAKVAMAVSLVMALLYAAVAVPIAEWYSGHVVKEVDARVSDRLDDITKGGNLQLGANGLLPPDDDVDDAPIVVWLVSPESKPRPLTAGAPSLQDRVWLGAGRRVTVAIGHQRFRLQAVHLGNDWLVAGASLAQADHLIAVVVIAEVVAGPLFVLMTFLAALAIGLMARRPLEQARRRQLAFTADASHELRTPVTVIQAEIGLALGADRQASSYRETLERVGAEGQRLRRMVEDLLFLARFDSAPPAPTDEPIDVVALAEACAERFVAVAQAQGVDLVLHFEEHNPAMIKAPPAWLDRFLGVLVDNACRFAGHDGIVRISVLCRDNSVGLVVEDTGPGIPPDERRYIFDRFHRSTGDGQGAGLGLAIADAVVQSTGGKWRVGSSELGGARMQVTWRRHHVRHLEAKRASANKTAV